MSAKSAAIDVIEIMITLDDVAKEAGVSASTVSIVVNDRRVRGVSISDATRERVLHVARKMGYTPNSLSRALATGKTRVFGLIHQHAVSELLSRITFGAHEECEQIGHLIKPFPLREPELADSVVQNCLSERIVGIIICNLDEHSSSTVIREASRAGVPVAAVDSPVVSVPCTQVTSDSEHGVRIMCDYLVSLGHRRIGFIAGPADSAISISRKASFRAACLANAVDARPEDIVDSHWGDSEVVTKAVTPLLLREPARRPTALFCAGDAIAMMVIRAARSCGLRIPEDLSVVGFSNMSFAYLCDPPLTTVAQDFNEIGREAIRRLRADAASGMSSETAIVKVPTTLVVRGSALAQAA